MSATTYKNVGIIIILFAFVQEVLSQKLDFSGNVSAGGHHYIHNGIDARQPQYGYSLSASARVSYMGVQIPFMVSINEQGGRFENPFNRFGISPTYKWIKAHLGWRSMQFSNYSLSNVSFLGAGVELTPGKWRLSGMYGRFREAAKLSDRNYRVSQYERNGYAIKLGYGTHSNYVDLVFFRAEDDQGSLNKQDSLGLFAAPKENAVIGMRSQLSFFKNALQFHVDGGVSAFSEDITKEGFEEENEWLNKFSGIFNPNISSHINYAGEIGLGWHKKLYALGLLYRRVMPEYKSLGINYLLNDTESITINPRLILFDRKITLQGSVGIQRNNLDEWRQRENGRVITNVSAQWNPSPYFGMMAQYSNFSFKQHVVRDTLINEQLFFHQVTRNWLLTPRYMIKTENGMHSLIGTINLQSLDQVTSENNSGDSKINLYTLSYAWNSLRRYRITFNANYFNYNSAQIELERVGATAGFGVDLFEQKFKINLTGGLQQSIQTSDMSWHGALDMRYELTKSLHVSGVVRFWSSGSAVQQHEGKSELRISQRF